MADESRARLFSGAMFGFFQTVFMAFAMLIPTMYFSSLNISIAMFAFLLSIGDVFSFAAKPILGHLTDRHGERVFLLVGGLVFISGLFMIGQTTDLFLITIFKITSGIASALMFVTIFIYSLRFVDKDADRKVGLFNGLSSLGWIIGFLIPGFFIDRFGISSAFYLILVSGLVWVLLMYKFASKKKGGESARPSFGFLRKTWKYIIFKTMDLAMFSAFVFFFSRYALKTLGLSGGVVSLVVIAECILFSGTNFVVGRISNKRIRKYWLPLCIAAHLAAATIMVFGNALPHYFIVAALIGMAGGLIDIWTFSRISDDFAPSEKGKVISTLGWNNDLATIAGAQVPLIFITLGLGTFTALYVFPIVMAVTYIAVKATKHL